MRKAAQNIGDETIARIIRAIAIVAVSHAALRRLFAEHSIIFFAWYYLKITLTPPQARWIREAMKSPRYLRLAPTGHGKTEAIAKVLVIRMIAFNRNVRILIISKSEDLAIKNLIVIKTELRTNTRLIRDFRRFYSPRNTWQTRRITVIRDLNLKDYTVEAVGLLGSITGGRFDIIIGDDIIDRLSVLEAAQRRKIEEYVYSTILERLTADGLAWFIGTRKHHDDIYNNFIENPVWQVEVDKALLREPTDYEVVKLDEPVFDESGRPQTHTVIIHGEDHGECLSPELWPMEKLLLKKFGTPRPAFLREQQNEVVDDETSLFPRKWLEACCDKNMSYFDGEIPLRIRRQYRVIVLAFDPSLKVDKETAENRDTDYMAGIGYGLRSDSGDRDLLAFVRERGLTPDKKLEKIETVYYDVDPDMCFIESNSFGEVYHWFLVNEKGIKVLKHKTDKNKHDEYEGVPSLSPLFENKMIHMPYATDLDKKRTELLMQELHGLGVERHKDLVMALWFAERGIQRYLAGQIRLKKMKQMAESK